MDGQVPHRSGASDPLVDLLGRILPHVFDILVPPIPSLLRRSLSGALKPSIQSVRLLNTFQSVRA
eukprot:4445453-Amphidinium_carterae.1